MAHKAGLKHTRKQGRPYKHLTCSYDDSADRTFNMVGSILAEAEDKSYEERLKAVQVCLPLAMKRIPDKVITANVNLALSDELSKRILAIMDTAKPAELPPPDVYVTPIDTTTSSNDAPKS